MEESVKGVEPDLNAGLDLEVFEKRIVLLPKATRGFPLDKKNAFIVTGPTGSGKTTILRQLFKDNQDVYYLNKEFTRELREGEPAGHRIPKEEFESKFKSGFYISAHKVDYICPDGQVKEEFYGAPKKDFLDAISRSDVVMTLGEPKAFQAFFSSEFYNDMRQHANIIPILITTTKKDDLEYRLQGRRCSVSERDKRLLQIENQWSAFDEMAPKIQHTILNDNPGEGPMRRGRVPSYLKSATYSNLDLSLSKLKDIVALYRKLKESAVHSVSDLDAHNEYVEHVIYSYFGNTREAVAENLRSSPPRRMRQDSTLMRRIKSQTGLDFLTDHVFNDLAATELSCNNGILEIKFNTLIKNMKPEDQVGALSIMEAIMTPPFYGENTEKGLRYSLTDVRPTAYSDEKAYAVQMKFL